MSTLKSILDKILCLIKACFSLKKLFSYCRVVRAYYGAITASTALKSLTVREKKALAMVFASAYLDDNIIVGLPMSDVKKGGTENDIESN